MTSKKPLNILHLATHLNLGGIASYISTLAKAMAKNGHRSSVISSGGSAHNLLTRAGVSYYQYNLRTKNELNPKIYWQLPSMVQLVKGEGFGILHAHTRVTQVLAYFLSRRTGIPYVSTAHGFYTPKLGRKLFPAWGEKVVAISDLVAQELHEKHHVDEKKIRVIYNAIDLDDFERRLKQHDRKSLRLKHGIPKDAFVVGAVSRLVEDKGHLFLIKAVEKLIARYPGIFLLIVGDGRERDFLEKTMQSKLTQHSKLIPGVIDTTEVYRMMDVFVHPATFREGFGLAIAEAMVAGLPALVTDIPAMNTLITHDRNGWIVPPKDADALAEALGRLIENPALMEKLSTAGRASAVAMCQPGRMADQMESLYQEVIASWKKS